MSSRRGQRHPHGLARRQGGEEGSGGRGGGRKGDARSPRGAVPAVYPGQRGASLRGAPGAAALSIHPCGPAACLPGRALGSARTHTHVPPPLRRPPPRTHTRACRCRCPPYCHCAAAAPSSLQRFLPPSIPPFLHPSLPLSTLPPSLHPSPPRLALRGGARCGQPRRCKGTAGTAPLAAAEAGGTAPPVTRNTLGQPSEVIPAEPEPAA